MQRACAIRLGRALAVALAAGAAAAPSPAAAASAREQCVAASEKAQELRNAGHLEEARAELAICGRAECPRVVRHDCTQWMSEVLAILPSVVFGAKDRAGRDLVDVKVTIDGKLVTKTLDGKPFTLDPGVHDFTFEARGAPPLSEKIVVRQGEKNRLVTVKLGLGEPEPTKRPDGGPAGIGSPPPAEPTASSPPFGAYVVGGLGIGALAASLYLALDANADARKLRDECAPNCDPTDVEEIEQRRVVAGVTAAVGGALLVTGIVLLFLHDRGSPRGARTSGPVFSVAPVPGGAGAGALLRF